MCLCPCESQRRALCWGPRCRLRQNSHFCCCPASLRLCHCICRAFYVGSNHQTQVWLLRVACSPRCLHSAVLLCFGIDGLLTFRLSSKPTSYGISLLRAGACITVPDCLTFKVAYILCLLLTALCLSKRSTVSYVIILSGTVPFSSSSCTVGLRRTALGWALRLFENLLLFPVLPALVPRFHFHRSWFIPLFLRNPGLIGF